MCRSSRFFFFNDTATTEIYTLSLHDALPICGRAGSMDPSDLCATVLALSGGRARSEEHTSELQSHLNLVCRLLLEKKNKPTSGPTARKRAPVLIHESPRAARIRLAPLYQDTP